LRQISPAVTVIRVGNFAIEPVGKLEDLEGAAPEALETAGAMKYKRHTWITLAFVGNSLVRGLTH